jgi:hypothetical protein
MAGEVPQWAIVFSKYLDAFGYDNAGLAWGLAHIEDLAPTDHDNIINILTKENL